MKKTFAIIISVVLVLTSITGCIKTPDKNNNKKFSIVTTIFPEYDWVREITGENNDNVNLTMLIDRGVDLHSFQPNTDDMITVSTCDMFIYVGGESDKWVDDALKSAVNKNMVVINLLEVLGENAKEEELISGMQVEENEDEHDDGETEYDEHVWLSLKNAAVLCEYIGNKLCECLPESKDIYLRNTKSYVKKLNELDSQYKSAVYSTSKKTLLFGDRFPFRYLVDDYGLDYYAAFAGCSAETEASFQTIIFLAGKVDELGLNSIMCIEGSNVSIANTIRENTASKDQKILTLDSMQSTTAEDVKNGVTYLSIMQSNLSVLKEALM